MIRVAIDTCSASASIAIQRAPGTPLGVCAYPSDAKVADVLFSDLHSMLRTVEEGASSPKIQSIVATIGPGSFTGQRLGLAVAQGLAAAHPAARLYGPTTLHAAAIAQQVRHRTSGVSVVADARRNQFYVQCFDLNMVPTSGCVLIDHDALPDRLSVESCPVLPLDQASAEAMATFGFEVELASGQTTSEALLMSGDLAPFGLEPVERLRPLYLKPPDAAPSTPAGLRASA